MVGNSIEKGVKGNRLFGDKVVSLLGKPTRPKPQHLPKESPLLLYILVRENEVLGDIVSMKFSFKDSAKWSFFISIVTLFLSSSFTIVSTIVLSGVNWGIGILVVFIIIFIGVFFDMLGLAAAAAIEKPFHSMASEKINGAKQSIRIVRNADKFSNFCNDVVGDISGIVSGTASAAVVLNLISNLKVGHSTLLYSVVSVVFTATVAALTVGGKAFGKSFAIVNSTQIILFVGKFFSFLETRLHIIVFGGNKKGKQKARGKNGIKPN
ncbi:hypothetical protein [Tepidibacillus marianensis]|uniref:hypothetical protein n=1 Tax=Tepidibacillus marianensis TaxID=3131995 RepID=UPI0030CDEC01